MFRRGATVHRPDFEGQVAAVGDKEEFSAGAIHRLDKKMVR